MEKEDKKRKGVFTPDEFFKLGLTHTQMFMLSIYKYYTEEGNLKCCVYKNQKMAEILNVSEKTVKKAKKLFKDLGYIRTDGGIKTYYTGIAEGKNFHEVGKNIPEVGKNIPEVGKNIPEVGKNIPEVGEKYSLLFGEQSSPHNKEEKRIKKENNKEIIKNKKRVNKEEMESELKEKQTVSDRVIDLMKQDKDLKEHIDYIIENYKTEIDDINKKVEELVEEYGITEDEITDTYLKEQIKMLIKNKLFQDNNIKFNTKELHKEKKEVNENDYFDL